MPMPFHQPQLPVQFGGPNPQMQSQGMVNSSMPMPIPIPLPMGNPPQVQQQVFVPGIQPHPMPPQGIMHQGQSLNFSSQMGPPLAPQLGNMGISMGPQFQHHQQQQQQAGKYGGSRKTVKITHPDTHEELRLDRTDAYGDSGPSVPRSHPNMPPQSQPIPSYPHAHTMNYYPNSFNASPVYFPAPGSVPLTSPQIPSSSHAPRFYNQVTVKPAASSHGEKIGDSPSLPVIDKGEFPKISRPRGEASSVLPQKDSISESSLQQSNSTAMPLASKTTTATFGSVSAESLTSASSAPVDETDSRSSSIKDEQKKAGKKGHALAQDQVGGESTSVSSLPSQSLGVRNSLDSEVAETVKSVPTSSSRTAVSEIISKPLSSTGGATVPGELVSKSDSSKEGQKSISVVGADSSPEVLVPKPEKVGSKEQGELVLPKASKHDDNKFEISSGSTLKSSEAVNRHLENSDLKATTSGNATVSLETAEIKQDEAVGSCKDDDRVGKIMTSTTIQPNSSYAETLSVNLGSSASSHGDKALMSDDTVSGFDSMVIKDDVKGSGSLDPELPPITVSVPEATSGVEGDGTESNFSGLVSPSALGSKDKPVPELNRAKSTTSKGKKKKKEMLQKADAQGTTSDLYMAYKGPEEKREAPASAESTESSSSITLKQVSADASEGDVLSNEKRAHSKPEPDDWEDAADISTPKLDTLHDGKKVPQGLKLDGEDEIEGMTKKYSRDFLLKFSEQCNELPKGFKIPVEIAEAFIASNINVSRESYPSPGRAVDRPAGGPRLDRRASFQGEEDKWSKLPGPLVQGRDLRLDIGYGGNGQGFRPGPGGNYGVLRNPRGQTPVQHAGGILSGPMQSPGPQGGMQRNNIDSERWQRSTSFHKGLIPSPQTPLQVMHKAERKYEVGKITDEEQAKQRQLKGILNKLTPQNFDKLFEQVKQVNIDNTGTLSGVIAQIFDKALMEPTFCEMYANFCHHLAGELPDFREDNERITFKRLLLNKCQEEFERGEREQEEANRAEEEGEVKQTEEEREEKRIKARRRMLGNIRLIGELYKKRMLTERIMHECIKKLLGEYENPDEEDVEALCKLMSTIGEMIDHPKAKEHMDAYFEMMYKLSNNMKLSSRVRFMLKDSIDLRKNKWQQRRKVEGPKKIEEVHRDAAQERQAQSSRLARGPSLSSSGRRGQPTDFAPRGSNVLPSPNAQMGGFRGLSQPLRGYGNQDARYEERHAFENRPLSVPLRSVGDDSITLGPQGGLARGMSIRGQPSIQSIPLADMPSPADSRRATAGPNGYSSVSERTSYGTREDLISRYIPERFVSPSSYDHSSLQERNVNYMNRDTRNIDRSFDRPPPTSPPTRGRGPSLAQAQNDPLEKVWPEERLRDVSMEAIKEFYSAKDEKEVALCIKELNAPTFYPSMISIWVTDSFERKDMERDLLAKLLVNLTKSHEALLNQDQLVRGFESVLASLDDAVTDAPKAAEFLGRILARVLLESAIPYTEVWRLIYEGGEEQGRLVELGHAADVLGVILEIIKSERGDPFLTEMRAGSNLRVENFRPPGSKKSCRLDKFI